VTIHQEDFSVASRVILVAPLSSVMIVGGGTN
jgi:hypothetical protein